MIFCHRQLASRNLLIVRLWIALHPLRALFLGISLLLIAFAVYASLPHGFRRLEKLEAELNALGVQGVKIESVRSGLSRQGIAFNEWVQTASEPLLSVGTEVKIATDSGDQVIGTVVPTEAWQFPCSIDLNVYFVFDANGGLIKHYIRRFRRGP